MAESSLERSSGDSCSVYSKILTKVYFGFSVIILFIVFGFQPISFSNGLILLAIAAVLKSNKRRDEPVFLYSITMDLSVSSIQYQFHVLFSRLIFPLSQRSRTGHSKCWMKGSLQNWQSVLRRNTIFGVPNSSKFTVGKLITCSKKRIGLV